MGLNGTLCIHPKQVEVLNAAFTPPAAEIEGARAVLAAWESGGGQGVVSLDGRMIDLPVVDRARRTLAQARGV
jgi:citrate lyase subunit beta/citryl-CoA lyase